MYFFVVCFLLGVMVCEEEGLGNEEIFFVFYVFSLGINFNGIIIYYVVIVFELMFGIINVVVKGIE